MWDPQARSLRNRYRIIRMDRHGFGDSRAAPSLANDARAIAELIATLNLRDVALVGMSQGGRIALRLAENLADRLACLVLDGAPWEAASRAASKSELPLDQFNRALQEQGLQGLHRALEQHPFTQLHHANEESRVLLRRILSGYSGRDLLVQPSRSEESPRSIAPLRNVSAIRMPTLVLNGELDSAERLAMGDALRAALHDAQRALVSNAGHLPNLDNPDEYNATLVRFIERHRPV